MNVYAKIVVVMKIAVYILTLIKKKLKIIKITAKKDVI
jgi:hypothetical protein